MLNNYQKKLVGCIFFFLVMFLQGCSDAVEEVPVANPWRQPLDATVFYTVKPGETLYSIAWFYDLDYRQIAAKNHIGEPYAIHSGQKLILTAQSDAKILPKKVLQAKPAVVKSKKAAAKKPTSSRVKPISSQKVLPVSSTAIVWGWPIQGKIINNYASTAFNKGIDIVGKMGSPVRSAASGKVVYAGCGLRGYGELIIIKHSDEFLSAYAHNQKILVHEGQTITKGQIVALMGNSEAKCVMLHFEIRKAGKPVNPFDYLPKI